MHPGAAAAAIHSPETFRKENRLKKVRDKTVMGYTPDSVGAKFKRARRIISTAILNACGACAARRHPVSLTLSWCIRSDEA
jgi:hypothetical protein